MSDWNAETIAEFRANEGRVDGNFEGAPMVLLHHRGRKSGREYVTPTMYLPHDTEPDIIYVFATKAGAPTNPDWYHNLAAAGDGSVERGTTTYKVTVRELTGAERDRIYAEQARRYPGFAEPTTPRRAGEIPGDTRGTHRHIDRPLTACWQGHARQHRLPGVAEIVRRTRSGGLPQLDPIALRIGDPAESADTLHVLRFLGHVRSLGGQLREHRIQVADPEVEHGLLGAGPEVAGPGLERREHRQAGSLTPQAVLIGVQAQAIAIPRAQGRRVGGPHEVSTDSKHTFHAAILPGQRSAGLAPHHRPLHARLNREGTRNSAMAVSAPAHVMDGRRPVRQATRKQPPSMVGDQAPR